VVAVAAALFTLSAGVAVALEDFPRGLLVLLCGLVAAAGSWEGVLRRGWARAAALGLAVIALAGGVLSLADEGFLRALVLLGVGALVWHVAARIAFDPHIELPAAHRPEHAVLFVNPRSGDGKAGKLRLADEARSRGIRPVELHPEDDLESLVRAVVADGADAVAMAGGDGSQAVVAAVAAERGLPYACIPSGTRNHFALDLGVDRKDVVGALDAFVDGGERVVDLGEVNGRAFVNNVSLGVYASAVQRSTYRSAKLRVLLQTVPDVVGRRGSSPVLRWVTPGGREKDGATVILVSNGQYRLGGAAGAGTRPTVDEGLLGVTIVDPRSSASEGPGGALPWRQWSAPEFRVDADGTVPAGIDGEAAVLAAPVLFRVRPAALRVRIAAHHPGASPSALEPVGAVAALRALVRIAAGRHPHIPSPAPAPVPTAGRPRGGRTGSSGPPVVDRLDQA
jgi:diacylglycerol kinase family enzyme